MKIKFEDNKMELKLLNLMKMAMETLNIFQTTHRVEWLIHERNFGFSDPVVKY